MVFFGYHKHKQKTWKFAWQHFGTQSSLWDKTNLDSTVRLRELDKINVYTIYNLQFFNGHRASCLWFMKNYQTKENWKIMQCPSIKSPFFYGSVFFPKKNIVVHLLFKNVENTFFFNEISSKNFKFLNGPKFNSCISISYTIKKIHPRIPLTTLVLNYICNFCNFCDNYYFVTNILHMFNFSFFVGFSN